MAFVRQAHDKGNTIVAVELSEYTTTPRKISAGGNTPTAEIGWGLGIVA